MRTIYRDIVSALIFSKDGKLFQGKKDPMGGGVYIDCWHIPGGGIDDGENKEEALIREIKEETGIDISHYHLELIDKAEGKSEKTLKETGEKVLCNMTFYTYKVVINDKDTTEIYVNIRESGELVESRWSTLDDLSALALTPPSVELFTKLGYLK